MRHACSCIALSENVHTHETCSSFYVLEQARFCVTWLLYKSRWGCSVRSHSHRKGTPSESVLKCVSWRGSKVKLEASHSTHPFTALCVEEWNFYYIKVKISLWSCFSPNNPLPILAIAILEMPRWQSDYLHWQSPEMLTSCLKLTSEYWILINV
jgi:hypothetical protein